MTFVEPICRGVQLEHDRSFPILQCKIDHRGLNLPGDTGHVTQLGSGTEDARNWRDISPQPKIASYSRKD